MAYGHTDDVPNTFDLEAQPTPESTSVPPGVKELCIRLSNITFNYKTVRAALFYTAGTSIMAFTKFW
ncbi:MAG: hypothetical protein ACKVH8_17455 [Pirellulales bacterium]